MIIKNWWPFRSKKAKRNLANSVFSSMEKVYTPVSQLVLGMYVVELDRPWLETPFLFQGFELKTKAEIHAIRKICQYVYVDMTRRKATSNIINIDGSSKKDISHPVVVNNSLPPKRLGVFEKEIIRAEKTYANTEVLVSDFMQRAAKGGSIDGWLAKQAVAECVNSILHSPDAMLWLTQLKNKDQYTAQHSLNVCVLSIVLGRHLNLPEKHLNVLGLCGMMFDMGKMLVPLKILHKPGKLEEEELRIMQSHTTLGYELLKSSDHMPPSVIETALTHHERLDGNGYPRKLKNTSISDFAKMVAIVDAYDAITSNRIHQKGRTHLEATHMLTTMAGTHFDPTLVFKFIESLGVYPPGCLVVMTNQAIAIVVEVNEEIKLRPKVIIILDEEKNVVPEKVIDLSEMVTDKNGEVYTIKNVVRPEDWNIDSRKYYEEGVLQKSFSMSKK